MSTLEFILRLSLYAIPLYLANSMACVLGGKTRLDLGIKWIDNRELLGQSKTIKGAFFGIIFGTGGAATLAVIFPTETTSLMGDYFMLSILLSFGAVMGDIVGSFIKRRLAIEPGKPALFLDQFDFLIGGFALVATTSLIGFGDKLWLPTLEELVALFIITFFAHKIGNIIGYYIKIKKVPW